MKNELSKKPKYKNKELDKKPKNLLIPLKKNLPVWMK